MTTSQAAEPAYAKINLYLEVLRRRPDGYHDLDSLAVFADLGERLRAEPSDGLSLRLTGPMAPALDHEADNLVLRAARRLRDAAGLAQAGAALVLDKHIPVAAGLGGGSADAAAALRLLNRFWKLDWPLQTLMPLARDLGADVPVCLAAQACYMRGTGGLLEPAPALPPLHMLLANPRVAVPTAAVFRRMTPRGGDAQALDWNPAQPDGLTAALQRRANDMTGAAIDLAPAIRQCLDALAGLPGVQLARMSGSGATCFALLPTAAAASHAAQALQATHPDWFVHAVTAAAACSRE